MKRRKMFVAWTLVGLMLAAPSADVLGAKALRFKGKLYLVNVVNGKLVVDDEPIQVYDIDIDEDDDDDDSDVYKKIERVSRQEMQKVDRYVGFDSDRANLAVFYKGIAKLYRDGKVDNLQKALDGVFKAAVGNKAENWRDWDKATRDVFNEAGFEEIEEAADGIDAISDGVATGLAIDWAALLKLFFEVIWPLIQTWINSGDDDSLIKAVEAVTALYGDSH